MLQKYYGCHGSRDTLTGEVYRQARVWAGAPGYIYARGELEAASCELLYAREGELVIYARECKLLIKKGGQNSEV